MCKTEVASGGVYLDWERKANIEKMQEEYEMVYYDATLGIYYQKIDGKNIVINYEGDKYIDNTGFSCNKDYR